MAWFEKLADVNIIEFPFLIGGSAIKQTRQWLLQEQLRWRTSELKEPARRKWQLLGLKSLKSKS